jgi:hypothetical protein
LVCEKLILEKLFIELSVKNATNKFTTKNAKVRAIHLYLMILYVYFQKKTNKPIKETTNNKMPGEIIDNGGE